jgi:hypothetical protein
MEVVDQGHVFWRLNQCLKEFVLLYQYTVRDLLRAQGSVTARAGSCLPRNYCSKDSVGGVRSSRSSREVSETSQSVLIW